MPVILVIIIAVAWLVILVPGFLRRRSTSGETDSISHFHQQLRILEHSAPRPIVAPAYRLRAPEGDQAATTWRSTEPPTLTVVGARDLPKPALAFLGDDRVALDGQSARPASPATVTRRPQVLASEDRVRAEPGARRLARQRRRDTLGVLVLAVLVSFMIGFLPGGSVAWVASGVLALALVVYVALLVHLRRLAVEREQKLRYLRPPRAGELAGSMVPTDDATGFEGHGGVFAVR